MIHSPHPTFTHRLTYRKAITINSNYRKLLANLINISFEWRQLKVRTFKFNLYLIKTQFAYENIKRQNIKNTLIIYFKRDSIFRRSTITFKENLRNLNPIRLYIKSVV